MFIKETYDNRLKHEVQTLANNSNNRMVRD